MIAASLDFHLSTNPIYTMQHFVTGFKTHQLGANFGLLQAPTSAPN
jgi:hypothetical protein